MNIWNIVLFFIPLVLLIAIFLYLSNIKRNVKTELSSHGFLGKKLILPILIAFFLISSIGITQYINYSNLDNRSLADISKSLVVTYKKIDTGYELTGKFENNTSTLVNFIWEIENTNQKSYKLNELKEFISKVQISNPTLPIKIILTIQDNKNKILAKREIIIK